VFNEVRTEVIKLYWHTKKVKLDITYTAEQEEMFKKKNYEEEKILEMLAEDEHLYYSDPEEEGEA
jgi:hypothetical protein